MYDESYGAFLSAMPPINAIQIPFVPLALSMRYKHPFLLHLNVMVMRLQYMLFMSIFFLMFVIVSVILLPIAYIVGMVDKVNTMKQP